MGRTGLGRARSERQRELGRICLEELAHAVQSGQLAALHIISVHAVEEEGAVQVLHEGSLGAEGRRGSVLPNEACGQREGGKG